MSVDVTGSSDSTPGVDQLLATEIAVVARGTLYRGISLGTGLLLALPASAVLVRSLGVGGYGALSFASGIAGIAAIVSDLGLGVGIARMGSHQDVRDAPWARLGAMTGLAVGITASLVVLTLAQLFHGPTELALAISAPMALFGGMRSILGGALVAKRRILLLEGTLAAQNLVYYGGGILLAILGAATVGRVASIQTLATAMGVLTITPAWILGVRATQKLTFVRWKQLLSFSVPLLIAGISGMVLQRSDVILLGILRGPDAVGRYAPVLKLVDVANVALIALGSYFVPVATRLVARKAFGQLRSVYTVIAKWAVVLAAPLLVTLIVEPAPLLTRLFGAPFSQSGNIAVALSLGYGLNIIAGTNGLTLVALGKSRQIGVRSVLAVVGNIVLNALLIPRFGALGAAIGTSLVYAALNIANSFLIYRAARIHPLRRDFVTVLGVIAAVAVVGYGGTVAFGLRHSIWGSVGVLGVTAIVGPTVAILTATPEERALRHRIVSRLARRARKP